VYARNMDRLKKKLETARALMPAPEVREAAGAEVGLIAYGSSHWAVVEALDQLRAAGVNASYLRVRALPMHADVHAFVKRHARVYVVEQNRDAQLTERLRNELPERAAALRPVLHYIGLPLDARSVTDGVLAHEGVPVTEGAPR
jgi:2-oxoglutarate ferredoxin oxidoreductase subunit alpha